ncbi:MAG: ferritin [Calditrichaeota bacterium]|nr:ferritin [Calditrichota bacterium]
MTLDKSLAKALNDQLNREFYSANLYLAMAASCQARNLEGFAHWFRVHSAEERTHALKFYDYLYQRRSRATIDAVPKPPADWKTPLAAFEAGLAAEVEVSAHIAALVELAQKKNDHATVHFLQWFVAEQVEEEALFDGIIQKLKAIADHPAGLMIMDRALGERS